MSKRKKKNKTKKIIKSTLIIVITFIIIIFLYNTYANIEINQADYKTERTISTANEQTVENVIENSEKISTMLEKAMGSVVGISKLKSNGNSIFSTSNEDALGIGTGIIVTEDGYILSNEHVTGSKFSTCYITLESGKKQEGKVVWSDSDLDLSLTKIDTKNFSSINLGDSSKIKVGESVYAIGNPIGFEFRRTVTSGIISAKNRSIKLEENNSTSYMSDLIQTDATINPGNSGGPLINPNGEVIGINTVKISSADGIGFAIPINVVKGVIESFKNTGKFEQPTLGIYVYDKDVIPYLDNNIITFTKGIYVAQINKNGPAYNTELKEGDIINTVDNKEINTMNDLREYIYKKNVGDVVELNITRGKVSKVVKVVLRKKVTLYYEFIFYNINMSFLLNYFVLWIIMHYEKEKNKDLPDYMTNGKDTIAVRMATSKSVEKLILKLGCPVFMTSANQTGEKECTNFDEIEKCCPMLDGMMEGNVVFSKGSTIVDCTSDEIKILREGPISIEQIKEKLKNKCK